MNQIIESQTASGSIDPLAKEIMDHFRKHARSPEENKRRKAELDYAVMKNRIIAKERQHEALKERAKRALRGEVDYE
ncbi:MAG: hypothetical protein ACLQVX_22020 [Limisphaerales bacterium]